MTTERMIARKKELGYTNERIAALSGVPLSTVQKIFSGATASPRYDTMQALEKVLGQPAGGGMLHEPSAAYRCGQPEDAKKPGDYTIEDYLALPEDVRMELIDGVFYDMAAPNNAHQIIAFEIAQILSRHIRDHHGSCITMISPADVQLDCDDRTMLQPDVFVVCDRSKFTLERTIGAPDLVVEILSPSTRKKDMIIKLNKYLDAGVLEYWMVDLDCKKVYVYRFTLDEFLTVYTFDDVIPALIFEEPCEVDMAALYETVRFLF